MSGAINYFCCGLLWLGLLVKAPDLIRNWHEPSLRAINGVLAFASLCWLFGAPPTVGVINRVSGVPNLAAPLTYFSITAYSAALLILIAYWRGGASMARTTRSWLFSYTAVLVGIAALFVLGNPAEERRTDFDTYYATTPWIAEMIVLYLVAHLTAVTVSAVWSLRWAFQLELRRRPWLRASLLTIGGGTVISAGFSVCKLIAVVARWSGRDWTVLGTSIAPLCAGLGALLTVAGVILPMVGHHLSGWSNYRRLAPLDTVLDPVLTDRALRVDRPRSPVAWGTWRLSTILNGLHAIEPLLDKEVYNGTYYAELDKERQKSKRSKRSSTELATSAAWAAAIAAAAHRAGQPRLELVGESTTLLSFPRDPEALVLIADAVKRTGRQARSTASSHARAGSA